MLWVVLGAWASLVTVTQSAEPLVPLCSLDATTCEVTLVAAYRYTMVYNEDERWGPVTAREDGLYFLRGQDPCGGEETKLTDEEAATVIIGDGTYRVAFAVNDSVPGPPIVVYQGQEIILNFVNKLENEAATIHIHGFHQRGTPWMDGAGHVSQCGVAPGETFTYRAQAQSTGSFWYHAHLGAQYSMGLHGAVVVLNRNKEEENQERGDDHLPHFEAEYSLVIQDWMNVTSADVNVIAAFGGSRDLRSSAGGRWASSSAPRFRHLGDSCPEGPIFQPDGALIAQWPFYSALINGKGRRYYQHSDVAINTYGVMETYPVRKGKKYYFRIVCSALTYPFQISIDGHPLHVVTADGRPIVTRTVDSIIVSSGERFDFWIDAQDPDAIGNYWVRADTLGTRDGLGRRIPPNRVNAVLHYDGYPQQDPTSSRKSCTASNTCVALNCPYQITPDEYHTDCVSLTDIRATVPDYTPWEETEVLEIFLDLQIDLIGNSGTHPIINGIKNVYPAYPAQLNPYTYDDLRYPCDPTLCSQDTVGCECTYVIKIPLNKTVHIVMVSEAGEDKPQVNPHPMHIHGYTPQVVKIGWPSYDPVNQTIDYGSHDVRCDSALCNQGGESWTNPTWAHGNLPDMVGPYAVKKDTVFVPTGGYIVWRFKADNPGFWLLHCHIEYHDLDGMGLILQVGEPEDMPPAPERMPRCGNFRLTDEEYYEAAGYSTKSHSEKREVLEKRGGIELPVGEVRQESYGTLMICGMQAAVVVLGLSCIILIIDRILLTKKISAAGGYTLLQQKEEDAGKYFPEVDASGVPTTKGW